MKTTRKTSTRIVRPTSLGAGSRSPEAARLHRRGYSTNEIAELMGISPRRARWHIARARAAGLLPKWESINAHALKDEMRRRGAKVGGTAELLNHLTKDQAMWVLADVQPGEKLVAALARAVAYSHSATTRHPSISRRHVTPGWIGLPSLDQVRQELEGKLKVVEEGRPLRPEDWPS